MKKNKQDLASFTVVYHKRSKKHIWDQKIIKAKDMAEAIRKFEQENPDCEIRGIRAADAPAPHRI